MNTTATQLTQQVDELLDVLQRDLEHTSGSIEKLGRLRELVIKRDEPALGELLDEIRSHSDEYAENERLRKKIREEIASSLGWKVEEVRLGRLRQVVDREQAERVSEIRRQLEQTVSRLKREHSGTVVLLADLARFNRMLLNTFLQNPNQRGITYDARGTTKRGGGNSFVNMRF